VKPVARFIVKLADLAEAEGRALRAGSVHVGFAIALAVAGAVLGIIGVAAIGWAIFAALSLAMPAPAAAAICGVVLLGCSGGLLWTVRKMAR
jgi:hypothetical protein